MIGASPQFPQSKCGSNAGVVRMVYACAGAQTENQNGRLASGDRAKEVETGHPEVRAESPASGNGWWLRGKKDDGK